MEIVNIEKLDLSKPVVLTGRNENVKAIAEHLNAKLYNLPGCEDHFSDHPAIIKDFQDRIEHEDGIIILTTQSEEFLDCLLMSEFEFTQATVRHYSENCPYRIRVLSKAEALADRETFRIELRV